MKRLFLLLLTVLPLSVMAEEPVTPPSDRPTRTMYANVTSTFYNYTTDTSVEMVLSGQDVYIQGLCLSYPEYWIKGTMNAEGTITFPQRQFLFLNEGYDDYMETDYSYPIYAYGISPDGAYCDFKMHYDYDTDTYTSDPGTDLTEVADYYGSLYPNDRYTNISISSSSPSEEGGTPTVLPDGLKVKPYTLSAMEWTQGEITYDAGIAIDGTDAYLTDFCMMAQDSGHCLKGYTQGDYLIFPAEQYLDTYEDDTTPATHFFVYGADFDGATLSTSDLILYYDRETDSYTASAGIMVSMGRITSSTVSFAEFLTGVVFQGEGIEGIEAPFTFPKGESSDKGGASPLGGNEGIRFDLQGRALKTSPFKGERGGLRGIFFQNGNKLIR